MQRKKYDGPFKAKVALEVVKGLKTINEIAADFGVHPKHADENGRSSCLRAYRGLFASSSSPGNQERETERLVASLYQKIGQLEIELDRLKKNLLSCNQDRRGFIEVAHPRISIARQCELLDVCRSGYYYKPATESELNLMLMRLIDEHYTRFPYYGSPRMTAWLCREGYRVNHKRIERLMRKMGIEGICPKRNLSKGLDEHKKYPYLLKGLEIDHPDQVWCSDISVPQQAA